MRTVLMLSASHQGQKAWFDEWSKINQRAIHTHQVKNMKTTLRNGDVYVWNVLSPAVLSMRVDTIHFDDRAGGRLSEEQEKLLSILPSKISPGPAVVGDLP